MTGFTFPNTVMNQGPLPPSGTGGLSIEFQTPDGMINETNALLDNVDPYSYGPNSGRPSTQTSYVNHPHRIQKVIPKMFIPSSAADMSSPDIPLEHALHDGDLTFTLRMPKEMIQAPSEFVHARNVPGRTLAQLVNLATVNYLLWGLQIGRTQNGGRNRWNDFYLRLTQGKLNATKDMKDIESIWNFLQSYIKPFGIMTGSTNQGGTHEGGATVATYPVDYVASFLIDGKAIKINNLWRNSDIAAGDDLILVLKKTSASRGERNLLHVLTSGPQTTREERTMNTEDFFYLCPAVGSPNAYEHPFIHIGRSQVMYSAYGHNVGGVGRVPWDSRASIIGHPVQMTFAPVYITPDSLKYRNLDYDISRKRNVPDDSVLPATSASIEDNVATTDDSMAETRAAQNENVTAGKMKKSKKLPKTSTSVSFEPIVEESILGHADFS